MATTEYSHAFLVGCLYGKLILNPNEWKREIITPNGNGRYEEDKGYNGLCGLFYKAHIDAMLEADDSVQKRPDFVQDVHHYYTFVNKEKQCVVFKRIKDGHNYEMKILKLHIFTFPLEINLFAIEIDDTGNDLNALTMGHFTLTRWAWGWDKNFMDVKDALNSALQPLKDLLANKDLVNLISGGNKLKLFQSIQLQIEEPDDKLLYEIGSSSAIGCIDNHKDRYCPSTDYWQQIVKENSVSTFRNWKALALIDSFTMLGAVRSFDIDDCNYLYFPLIYIRCIYEKTFCFSRNNAYREDDKEMNKALPEEIEKMEKYYFYDNISYNFQPNLLYKAMTKGLEIKEERDALSRQIKERAKEEKRLMEMQEAENKERMKEEVEREKEIEAKRFDKIMAYVAIFAVFSVIWDICSILMASSETLKRTAWTARSLFIIGVVLSLFFVWLIKHNKKKRNEKK